MIATDRSVAGGAEQNPADWLEAILAVMSDIAAQLGDERVEIIAMGVSAHGPGVVLTNEDARPMLPCAIWQDNRSARYGSELLELVGCDWVGHGMPQTGFAARLRWLNRTQPDMIRKARHIHTVKGYLLYALTGNYVTEPSSSGCNDGWSPDLLEACGVSPAQMDTCISSEATAGVLRADIAAQTGFPANTMIIAGLNDGATAMLGSGMIDVGKGVVSVSTNGIARVVADKKQTGRFLWEHSLFCWPYLDGKYVLGGFTKSAGDTVQWFLQLAYAELPESVRLEVLNHEAEQSGPGARGVRFYPWLFGRGSPASTDSPAGCFQCLARHHTRGDCARALFEGVAYALCDIGVQFRKMGYAWNDIRLTGGGMKSPLWRSIICNVLNVDGQRAVSDSLLGITMLTGVGCGIYPDIHAACSECVIKPEEASLLNPALTAFYEEAYQIYEKTKEPLAAFQRVVEGD